jgi:hypothetical protein
MELMDDLILPRLAPLYVFFRKAATALVSGRKMELTHELIQSCLRAFAAHF